MEWDPTQFFRPAGARTPYAILVLNQPINQSAWDILRKHACFTICADGGANQFYGLMRKRGAESSELPDAIVGDLDSITSEVRTHYEKLNVEVVEETEQYSTDFTKCLRYLRSNKEKIISASSRNPAASSNVLDIIVLGGLGGRVDQAFAQIHHLYTCSKLSPAEAGRPEGDIYIVSEESISFVLRQGHNTIMTPGGSRFCPKARKATSNGHDRGQASDTECSLSENIGIVPVGGPAVISTTGFEWDVRDWKTEIGGRISTSNHIREDEVVVETSVPVLFTVELSQSLKFSGRR